MKIGVLKNFTKFPGTTACGKRQFARKNVYFYGWWNQMIDYTLFFISNARLKLAKNLANAKQDPEAELLLFENYSNSSFTLSSEQKQKNRCVCIHEIIRLIIMKLKMKIENWSHRYDISKPRSRHGHITIKSAPVWWYLYVLSNTYTTFKAEFMKKLGNTETELKKSVGY